MVNVKEKNTKPPRQFHHLQEVVTGQNVELSYVDQGYSGEQAAADAQAHGIQLEVVKLPEAKKGFVLLLRGWVGECSFA